MNIKNNIKQITNKNYKQEIRNIINKKNIKSNVNYVEI